MVMPPQPRVCQLSKKEGGSYGFFLRIEKDVKGHLIRAVVKEGPADRVGLQDGDRVLRVNGVFVDTEDHQRVVELIKKSGTSVSLTVLDGDSYVNSKKQGIDLLQLSCVDSGPNKPVVNGVSGKTHRPRLCYLLKQEHGFGFSLKTITGVPGLFMTDISPHGAAFIAGVQPNDRILQLNGENVENFTHEQMVTQMKSSGINMVLLLIDEASDKYFKSRALPVVASMASVNGLPYKPRIVELTKEAQGYGFFLRMEQGHQGHYIRAIDPNSPAEKAGLVDGDLLVAVNGTGVEHLEHESVVDMIKKCGNKTTFLVVDNATNQLYKQAGISPLCYWNEVHESPCAEEVEASGESQRSGDGLSAGAKLCHITKGPEGFGFTISAVWGAQGPFIRQVVKGSPASEAGLEVNDVLIQVNGVNVEVDTHHELVERINSCRDQLSLLVVRKEENEHVKASEMPMSPLVIPEAMPEPISPPSDIQEDSRVEEAAEKKPEADEPTQKMGEQDESSSSSSAEGDSDDVTQM
ncbi:Na(+)/H(+) exchange regulatory cofactor NHE-RF3 isoform X2 [Pristis pectinata]|uniref:Na(+)/H(+) exchange regulatory cofactor NHE-RF3 isoform X2 n=1 Tax=Pristis pectinata TaxID=685728 RepID=UPI00223E87E4|nr:Na(+)/H(+) exchange regulatory cofactor NHE-RF3 isoform X2 [Pristis pectinata]